MPTIIIIIKKVISNKFENNTANCVVFGWANVNSELIKSEAIASSWEAWEGVIGSYGWVGEWGGQS
jgi:hypothetical protein